jgi:26S proteasome regulatory subunit T3
VPQQACLSHGLIARVYLWQYKALQKQLEFLETQEEYIKDEMKVGWQQLACAPAQRTPHSPAWPHFVPQQNLKRENIRAKEEITRIKSVPLVIGQFSEMVDENYGIVTR